MNPGITVTGPDLRAALNKVAPVLERRITIPVLGTVLVRSEKGSDSVMLCATDLDTEIRATLPRVDKGEAFSGCFSPAALRIMGDGDEVRIARDAAGITTLSDGAVALRIRDLISAVDFPESIIRGVSAVGEWVINEDVLWRALDHVMPSISTEETRYYLNGICLDPVGAQTVMVATDGHRLGKYVLPDAVPSRVIVPRKAVGILFHAMRRGGNRPVSLQFYGTVDGPTRISIRAEGIDIVAKLIDGTYPDYTRVIPAQVDPSPISIALNLAAVQRINVMAGRPGSNRLIAFQPEDGVAVYKDGDTEIEVQIGAGRGAPFGFNIKYVLAVLRKNPMIRIEGTDKGNPFRIMTADPNATTIIMPMLI